MKHELLPLAMAPNPYEVSINYKRPAFDEMKCVFGSSDANTLMREFIDCESFGLQGKVMVDMYDNIKPSFINFFDWDWKCCFNNDTYS